MVNTMPAKYTFQLGPLVEPRTATEIRALSYATGDSMSIVARRLIEIGLRELAAGRASAGEWAEPTDLQRVQALEYVSEYEARQLARRRSAPRTGGQIVAAKLAKREAAAAGDSG